MHTAKSFFSFFACLFVANCFQRKLLHAQSYEQTDEAGDVWEGWYGSRGSWYMFVCMYIGQAGRHLPLIVQAACAACEKLKTFPHEAIKVGKDQQEPLNGSTRYFHEIYV